MVGFASLGAALATHVATADPLAGRSVGQANYDALQDPRFAAREQHYLADHGLNHPLRLDMGGRSPIDVALQMLNAEPRAGKTVADWAHLANAQNLLALRPSAPAAPADLAQAVARLDADAGAAPSVAQLAQIQTQAAVFPMDVRAPFATLVAATATAWEAQAPIAKAIDARIPHATAALDLAMTDSEREATLQNALGLLAAQNAFRDAVRGVSFPTSSTPLFTDPAGLVVLGSTSGDTYVPGGALGEPILVVDPAGDDTYLTSAGSACPDLTNTAHHCNGLVVSMLVDLAGDDRYAYTGAPTDAQGSASLGGIGILVDVAGNDSYVSTMTRTNTVPIFMYIDGGAQGYGFAGVGILLDGTGNDRYEADITSTKHDMWNFAQGFGSAGGVGIAADGSGDDQWLAYGFDSGIPACDSCAFQGLYPTGTGFYGGVGIMSDTGAGKDAYHAWDNATTTDFYAYGFGAFGGTGIFLDDGGDDNYQAVESSTNPWIVPLLNCAYGTGSFAGVGVFLDMGGNDSYYGDTKSPRAAWTMSEGFGGPAVGEGLFIDVSGDDGHFMHAHAADAPDGNGFTTGRGVLLRGGEGATGNSVGAFLDLGGTDTYVGAAPSQDNAAWPAGVDFNAGMTPTFFLS